MLRSHAHKLPKKVRRLGLKCALSVRLEVLLFSIALLIPYKPPLQYKCLAFDGKQGSSEACTGGQSLVRLAIYWYSEEGNNSLAKASHHAKATLKVVVKEQSAFIADIPEGLYYSCRQRLLKIGCSLWIASILLKPKRYIYLL